MKIRILAAAAALCLILSACGGGNSPSQSESAPEAPEASPSAPASPESVPLAQESQPEDAAPAETVEGTPEENEAYAEAYELRSVVHCRWNLHCHRFCHHIWYCD